MYSYLGCASQSVTYPHPGYVQSVMSCHCPSLSVCHPKLRAFEPAARKNLATEALKKFDSFSDECFKAWNFTFSRGRHGKGRVVNAGSWLIHPVLAFNFTTNAWQVPLENCQQKSWQRIIKSLSLALQPQSSLKSFPGSQLAFSTRSPSTCMKKANCSAVVVLYLLKLRKALY